MTFEIDPGRLAIVHSLERAGQSFGDRLAIRHDGVERTWQETLDRVSRVAGGLRRMCAGASPRVAVAMANRPEYLELFYAIAWAGGVVAPLNTRLATPELSAYLAHIKAEIVVTDEYGAGALSDVDMSGAARIDIGCQTATGQWSYEELAAGPPLANPTERNENAVAALFSTGGTTGRPRAVMLTERNLGSNAYHTAIALRYSQDDVYLHAAPMFHIADCSSLFAVTLSGGAHTFIPRFSPDGLLAAVERERATATLLVPTMVAAVADHALVGSTDLSSWRTLFYGGAPMPPAVLRRAAERLPCGFVQGYGMTELSLAAVMDVVDHARILDDPTAIHALTSCGRPAPGVRIRILDDNGRPVRLGDVGELHVAGPNVSIGYWQDQQATTASRRCGWLRTGDLGRWDEAGLIHLVDRAKDVIITGGENVYSTEVEHVLHMHPQVVEAAVVGVPDAYWGESVHAVVVRRDGETAFADLDRHMRDHLAAYKAPRTYQFVSELPKTGAGKVRKAELRLSNARGDQQ